MKIKRKWLKQSIMNSLGCSIGVSIVHAFIFPWLFPYLKITPPPTFLFYLLIFTVAFTAGFLTSCLIELAKYLLRDSEIEGQDVKSAETHSDH